MKENCWLLQQYWWLCYLPLGKVFHAMVSVTAVKIQFSSPRGVLLSFRRPGILCIMYKSNNIVAQVYIQFKSKFLLRSKVGFCKLATKTFFSLSLSTGPKPAFLRVRGLGQIPPTQAADSIPQFAHLAHPTEGNSHHGKFTTLKYELG